MIIQTGNRTDIPAFYAEWFENRLREGYVMARNPFHQVSVTCYRLDPSVVDLLVFALKIRSRPCGTETCSGVRSC